MVSSKEIKKKIEEGWIKAIIVFEVVGSPKEHVESSLKQYIDSIKENDNLEILKEKYGKPEKQDTLWSTFCEAEMLVLGMENLTALCFNYSPASIEILEPGSLSFTDKDLSDWLTDLLSKLHETGAMYKAERSKNSLLEKNISLIMRNCVLSLIDAFDVATIASKLGVPEETIGPFLKILEKEEKIKKKGKGYVRI